MKKYKRKFADKIEQDIFEMLREAGFPEWEAEQEVLALREPLPMTDLLFED